MITTSEKPIQSPSAELDPAHVEAQAQAESAQPRHRKPRKPRGRGLRTTTGCAICRTRHMKCDEVKPVCGPCAKGNRPCVYNTSVKKIEVSATTSPASQPSTATGDQQQHASPVEVSDSTAEHQRQIQSQTLPPPPQVRWDLSVNPPASHSGSMSDHPTPASWRASQEDTNSPGSTISSNHYPVNVASMRWFGLLTDDAHNIFPVPYAENSQETDDYNLRAASFSAASFRPLGTPDIPITSYVQSQRYSSQDPESAAAERKSWQAAITLQEHEIPFFKYFVEHFSAWLDLYDPLKHFSTYVPQLALQNKGLMKAIMALSVRHLSIKAESESASDRTIAVQYYYETLQYLQGAMRYQTYTRSPELLATALIVSTYEMIDGSSSGWERHLKGVFWIQRSLEINGQSGGLKQAVWWNWLRQDFWAAFRERRRCFSFYKPTRPYDVMDQYDIASRAVYLLAQAVNYASDEERKMGEINLQSRVERADTLLWMLDEWRTSLTVHFNPLPLASAESNRPFKPIWINPPAFGAAVQMHNFARILLLIHRPAASGFREYLARDKALNEAIDTICGIALTITEEPSSVPSMQCLFGAGLYAQDEIKRAAILQMIEIHQRRIGWPITSLAEGLKDEWIKARPP